MHEKMYPLLNAYLDGELHEQQRMEMEIHLASCAVCQNELKELRLVSGLLQAIPTPKYASAERFISQITLSMPRHTREIQPTKLGSLAWWLVPVGLIGAWFFIQTVFTLTDLVTAANLTGLLGNASAWLSGSGRESIWFRTVTSLIVGQPTGVQSTLSLVNNVSIFAANLFGGFLWQAAIVLVYWGWLFLWWLRRGSRPMKLRNAS